MTPHEPTPEGSESLRPATRRTAATHPVAHRRGRVVLAAVTLVLASGAVAVMADRPVVAPAPNPASGATIHLVDEVGPDGYWLVAADGGVFAFGGAPFLGSTGDDILAAPVVAMVATPDSMGYWLVAADGGVFAFGDAPFLGSMGGRPLDRPVVGMAATHDGRGYWLVAADGGVFAFGDAAFGGSMGGRPLARSVVGMDATPAGGGYWLEAADGGVFAFGDAVFSGSLSGDVLAEPVGALVADPSGTGYWMSATDGGVFAFGGAAFLGSAAGRAGGGDAVGLEPTPDGRGYWLAGSDGGVSAFGDAATFGSAAGTTLQAPVVGLAPSLTRAAGPQGVSLSGDAPVTLLPGTTSTIDLRIANPTGDPVTVESTSTTITVSDPACAPSNFTMVHELQAPATVPPGTSATLSELGVPRADWPVLAMVDTATDQDVCKGVRLDLHYQAEAVG